VQIGELRSDEDCPQARVYPKIEGAQAKALTCLFVGFPGLRIFLLEDLVAMRMLWGLKYRTRGMKEFVTIDWWNEMPMINEKDWQNCRLFELPVIMTQSELKGGQWQLDSVSMNELHVVVRSDGIQ